MRLTRYATRVLAAAVAFGAIACGDDSSNNNTGTPSGASGTTGTVSPAGSSGSSSSSGSGTGGDSTSSGTGPSSGTGGDNTGGAGSGGDNTGGTGSGAGGDGTGGSPTVSCADGWPEVQSAIPKDAEIEQAVADLVAQMSVEQKVGQMVQAEIQEITPAEVRQYNIGSVLNGGGSWPGRSKSATADNWVALADGFYDASMDSTGGRLAIPIIWGIDAVHGNNNVRGATLFPHNIGLGAANDPDLMQRIGAATAKEVAATGLDWTFAPTLAVVRDDRWGRSYEGYSEHPEIVRRLAGPMVSGIQGAPGSAELFGPGRVIATAKHFLGDGGTDKGNDQGNNLSSDTELCEIHAQGYLSAIAQGAQTVMASYNSIRGQKMHGHRELLTDVLKGKFHFDGFVIGDWNGHGQVSGCTDTSCAAAINAGVDMIMVPYDWLAFLRNTISQVNSGEIPRDRVNDAVTRILRVKMRAGLFGPRKTKGKPSTRMFAGDDAVLGAQAHRDLAREAVRKSLVLLKNKGDILPLTPNMNVLVAGKTANSIPNQAGGWSRTWQGDMNSNADFPNAQSIYAGIEALVTSGGGKATLNEAGTAAADTFDAAIVVIGETPYAEMRGDIQAAGGGENDPSYAKTLEHARTHPEDLAVLDAIRSRAPNLPIVTVLVSGRPLYVNKELNRSDAFVAAWLPGSEGGGVADVLFGQQDFQGKLSFSWPASECQTPLNHGDGKTPLFPYGFGLTTMDADTLGDDLPEASTGNGCN